MAINVGNGSDKDNPKRRKSYKEKIKKDFALQKERMDMYIDFFSPTEYQDTYDKFNVNYDLMNGRLDVDLYDDESCMEIEGEKIKFFNETITHYPIISQVANALHGEMITRPFKPVTKDLSPMTVTLRDKKRNELIKQYVEANILNPIREKVSLRVQERLQGQDIFNMPIEQQQQLRQEFEQEVVSMTPEDIVDFMQNDYKAPTEQVAQKLMNFVIERQDVKHKIDQGAKHAIAVGEEYYYVGIEHGEPVLKLVNPKFFKWTGSRDNEWSHKGTWATYEQWLTYEDALQKHAEDLKNKDLEELECMISPIGVYKHMNSHKVNNLENRTIFELSYDEDGKEYGNPNLKTKAGQNSLKSIYAKVSEKYGKEYGEGMSDYGVREVHVVWREKRLLKKVTRIQNNKEENFWVAENYKRQPQDIEVKNVWVDEIWEGTRLGMHGDHGIYVNIRPLPYQYRSIYNPFNVDLPYYGKKYRTHQGNSKNISPVDLGKSWQKEFDVEMTRIKTDLATNTGNVFTMMMNMKPDNWKWQDWLNVMKRAGILLLDPHKHGLNNVDPQMMRSINIGKVSDLAGRIQLLDFYRSNLIQAMYFNPSRIGAIGQYATNTNIQASSTASYNQTEDFFETHRIIVEKALNALMSRSKMVYKNSPELIQHIFSDIEYTDFIMSPDFWYSEMGVYIKNSINDIQQIELLRGRMLEFIQNGMSFEGILGLVLADTKGEISTIMRKETKRLDRIRQENIAAQQQDTQAKLAAEAAIEKEKREFDYLKHTEVLQSQEYRTEVQADQWRRQHDVDMDGVNDNILKTQLELAMKASMEQEKLKFKREELDFKKKEAKIKKK